jgi:hypothetical protein
MCPPAGPNETAAWPEGLGEPREHSAEDAGWVLRGWNIGPDRVPTLLNPFGSKPNYC